MGEIQGRVVVVAVLAVIAVSIGALLGRVPVSPSPPSSQPVTSHQLGPEETVAVHVSGMVVSPGVVDVPAGAIVADAIEAAGGLLPGALADQINLAAPVGPGEQIVVPGPTSPGTDSGEADGLLSINQASATELETLPGVGPVLGERIVSYREANGRFETVEDLLQVPGIGEAKLEAIRDLVRP
jgi:competence protein ComEA